MTGDVGQIAVGCGFMIAGLLWARGGLRRWHEYSLAEDLKASFLRLRWSYSADLLEGGPRLIAPAMLVLAGLGVLVALAVRRL